MFCTKCAAEIKDESANFCQNCAAPIVRESNLIAEAEQEQSTEIPVESSLDLVDKPQPTSPPTEASPMKWNPAKRYGLLAGVLALIAVVVLISTNSKNSSDKTNAARSAAECTSLQIKINGSKGSERVQLLNEAGTKGCNIQVKPAPTNGTVSLPPEATWYPKGYHEYTDGLAWKWTDESCGYSSGYCWTMRVKTRDGCADGIYAEANIEQKGVVIGYTNDTIGSLRPGATAKIQFSHFGDSGTLSASLTELTCHNYSL